MLKRTMVRDSDMQAQAAAIIKKQALCLTDEADAIDFLELDEMEETFENDARAYMA